MGEADKSLQESGRGGGDGRADLFVRSEKYMHACIKQVQGEQITNKSLRERFGVEESQSASISRLIKLAVEERLIKPLDPETAPRYMRYIPIWA